MDARPWRETVRLHGLLAGDQQRCRRIADLTRAGGGQLALRHQGLERADLLPVRLARTLVEVEPIERGNLAVEAALRTRAQGPCVRLDRELLHLLAREVPLRDHHLRTEELIDLTAAVPGGPSRRSGERIVEAKGLPSGHRRRDRDHAHVLHTAGHHEVHGAAHHGLCREVHGLLCRSALAIDRGARDVLGKARREPCGPSDAAGLRSDRVHVAEDDVIDRVRIDACAVHQRLDAVRAKICRMHRAQSPATSAHGSTNGVDDEGFRHVAEASGRLTLQTRSQRVEPCRPGSQVPIVRVARTFHACVALGRRARWATRGVTSV